MTLGWSLGGIIGPVIISWLIGGAKNFTLGYTVIALVSIVLTVITVITVITRTRQDVHEGLLGEEAAEPT
ncbi:MAG: hypothetical protein ACYDDU_10620 [Dermatophilaceae bacterium]